MTFPVALLQNGSGEETTGILDQAQDAGKEAAKDSSDILKIVNNFFRETYEYLISTEFISNVLASCWS